MQNLRYKLLFIMSVFITGTHAFIGAINASEYYTTHTHEFLGYLGQKNPSAVPIRKMSTSDALYHSAAGYANGTAIYLNEDLFNGRGRSRGVNLFTCAHEAAHHALRHPFQTRRNTLDIEREADERAARMLCTHGYRWVVEQEVDLLRRCVQAGQGHHTDGEHPTTQQQYVYLSNILATNYERSNQEDNAPRERKPDSKGKAPRARKPDPKGKAPRERKPAREDNSYRDERNPYREDNAPRPRKPDPKGKAPRERNPYREDNVRKPDPKGKVPRERNPYREDNSYRDERNPYHREDNAPRERNTFRAGVEDFKDLLRGLNNLSREQKLVIAGILGMRFMGLI